MPSLLTLALLCLLLSGATQGSTLWGDTCSGIPDLQILSESISTFHCKRNMTLHAMDCSHQGIPALPSSSDPGVPETIEMFDFSYNKIMCLPKINNTGEDCDFKNCQAGCLLDLRLQNNEISGLHDDTFNALICLTSLDLSNNLISDKAFKPTQFQRLNHLHYLNLHGNPLKTLPDRVLSSVHLSGLRTLNLSQCQLESIGELALGDFFHLSVLDLSHNNLTLLESSVFRGLISVKILDLRWNRLVGINNDTFGDMRSLQKLRLDHNRLAFLSELSFHHKPFGLRSLSLFNNRFETIPVNAFAQLKKLRSLDMSYNPIRVLKFGPVVTTVRKLKLDNMDKLEKVKSEAFSAFPNLNKLSMRYNRQLTSIDPDAFRGTRDMQEVQLDNNALPRLPRDLLPWNSLSLLTLHDNPWYCDCRMDWASDHPVGNSTLRCQDPLKLRGQTLDTLTADELSCPKYLLAAKVLAALCVTSLFLAILVLFIFQKTRRRSCWCVLGPKGQYVTVFTKEKRTSGEDNGDVDDGSCGEGDMDELDLGSGEGDGSGSGRMTILLSSFRDGYRRLKNKGDEASQGLTMSSGV